MQKMITLTNDRYRLGYHVSAPAGWINDPNGFCYFKGYYHIFYQYHPYSADWGPMHWGHARSKDLVHWESLPLALAPDTKADEDGCFSGSAIVKDDTLYLIYTGHHYYGDGDPDHFWQNQNLAYSQDEITFTKYAQNPIIAHEPADNTHHFRDPKVFEKDGSYYMVLGSQSKDGAGRAIMYRSSDLKNWEYLGPFAKAKEDEGYMWECPDFFNLAGKDILLLSPQGIKPQKEKYLNLFQTGYFVGDYELATNTFTHGAFTEIDLGHDFYASQTTLTPDGRRVVLGWMDMWESDFPEKADGWAGALTLPRELKLKGERLYMSPIKELEKLRTAKLATFTETLTEEKLLCTNEKQVELMLDLKDTTDFSFSLRDQVGNEQLTLDFDRDTYKFTLTKGDQRFATIAPTNSVNLRIFVDTSSLEIFINDGEAVFTERFYLESAPTLWLKAKKATCQAEIYRLEAQAIEF